jgi:hypothetical protein
MLHAEFDCVGVYRPSSHNSSPSKRTANMLQVRSFNSQQHSSEARFLESRATNFSAMTSGFNSRPCQVTPEWKQPWR